MFGLQHQAEFDFGYGTLYNGADSNNANTRVESYGLQVWSFARYTATMNFKNWYKYVGEVSVEPVYVAPYIQNVAWTRPMGGNTKSLTLSGSRDIQLLNYFMYAKEEMGTFQTSLFDTLKNGFRLPASSDVAYSGGNFEHAWNDAQNSGNVLQKLLPSTYTDLSNNLLGAKNYYTAKIF